MLIGPRDQCEIVDFNIEHTQLAAHWKGLNAIDFIEDPGIRARISRATCRAFVGASHRPAILQLHYRQCKARRCNAGLLRGDDEQRASI